MAAATASMSSFFSRSFFLSPISDMACDAIFDVMRSSIFSMGI